MKAYYDKVIVQENEGEKIAVTIFDQKLHVPVTYILSKCGMDEILNLMNQNNAKEI